MKTTNKEAFAKAINDLQLAFDAAQEAGDDARTLHELKCIAYDQLCKRVRTLESSIMSERAKNARLVSENSRLKVELTAAESLGCQIAERNDTIRQLSETVRELQEGDRS